MNRVLRGLTTLLLITLLPACALNREDRIRAARTAWDARDNRVHCAAEDACAIESPYLQRLAELAAQGSAANLVNILDLGEDSLAMRIHLIRSARSSIDIQTFIYEEDDAGLFVLDELMQAARRGVRVRVLLDQLFSVQDTRLLARLASAHANFDIRLYNPTFGKARTNAVEWVSGVVCCFMRFNQRMHNKLLLVDGRIGITGGRNFQNRYFDWDTTFNYRDRDVLVAGPVGEQMRKSFEIYWRHDRAVSTHQLRDVAAHLLAGDLGEAPPALTELPRAADIERVRRQAMDPQHVRTRFLDHAFEVAAVEYFYDLPNKPFERHGDYDRDMTQRLRAVLESARESIVMQTPYLVMSRRARSMFRDLKRDHPELRFIISTNSLASTDAFYVYALSYKYKKRYVKSLGFEIYEMMPRPADAAEMVQNYAQLTAEAGGSAPRVGQHAKSFVMDDKFSLIGSHNFDPRSDWLNTENGLIIDDMAFAKALRASILRDTEPDNAWVIYRKETIPVISHFNGFFASISEMLPLLDFWPFRYTTSYQLREGFEPVPPGHPEFFERYEAVGDFPETGAPIKDIQTRLATAFGAFVVPIL